MVITFICDVLGTRGQDRLPRRGQKWEAWILRGPAYLVWPVQALRAVKRRLPRLEQRARGGQGSPTGSRHRPLQFLRVHVGQGLRPRPRASTRRRRTSPTTLGLRTFMPSTSRSTANYISLCSARSTRSTTPRSSSMTYSRRRIISIPSPMSYPTESKAPSSARR